MARVFITGSADGLGLMAARLLVEQGHDVTLHARNDARARDAMSALPGARGVVIGDLSSIEETRGVAKQANANTIIPMGAPFARRTARNGGNIDSR